jgi:hypothetical protein
MKTKIKALKKLTLLILIACMNATFAQSNEAFNNAINKSEYIFSGKVIESTPYWTKEHGFICTRNTIIVDQCLKGNLIQGQKVDIITEGGQMEDLIQEQSHSLELGIGIEGMYFCNKNRRYETNFTSKPSNLILNSFDDSEFGYIQFFNDKLNPFAFGFDQVFKTANDLIVYLFNFMDLKPFIAQVDNS